MKSIKFFLFLVFLSPLYFSQSPSCGSLFYIQSGTSISQQSVSPVISSSTSVLNNMPAGSNGLAIGPSFGFPAPDPTFWTTAGGTFWYYDGTVWTNTNHSTSNPAAINLGGSGNRLYNLAGNSGQVYAYDGTGPAWLVATIANFGGPYDIMGDDNDNFYLLRTSTVAAQSQSLCVYDPSGNLLCSYGLLGSPSYSTGGGFTIINNMVYNSNASGLVGAIVPGSPVISFSAQALSNGLDWASCSLPVPSGTVLAPLGSTLNCLNTTLPLVGAIVPGGIGMAPGPPSPSLAAGTFTWTGPGIVAGQNTASITVNQPGVYTFSVHSNGCPSQRVVQSFTVSSQSMAWAPGIVPPGCLSNTLMLSITSNSNTSSVLWAGPGIAGAANTPSITVNATGIYSATISNSLGCTANATVSVLAAPALSLSLSSNSLCALGVNASPTSLTLTPWGALTYTLLSSASYSSSAATAPWVCFPIGLPSPNVAMVTVTVLGSNGSCTSSATAVFSVIPNPTIAVTPPVSSVCQGGTKAFTASGATAYTWLAGLGLNTYSGSVVTASTQVTTVYSVYGSDRGCNSATETNTLTILPIPTVSLNAPASTICLGNTANLVAQGNANTYTWSASTGNTPTLTPGISVSPATMATYTVLGMLNTCTNVATATVNVVALPVLALALSSNTVCELGLTGSPNCVTITPTGALAYTLVASGSYSSPSPYASSMPVFPVNSTIQGALSIATATVLGSNGYCTVSASKTFTIIPNPVIVSSPSVMSMCPGQSRMITASGATNYSWTSNSASPLNITGGTLVASPSLSTIYSVVGSSMGCNSAPQITILNVMPIPSFSVSSTSNTLCSGTSVQLTALGNANTYTWYPGTGLSNSNSAMVVASPSVTQSYTLLGSNGCTNTAVATLSVIQSPSLTASASVSKVCKGAGVQLFASGANSFDWLPPTGFNTTTGANIIATPNTSTTFTVRGFNGICTGSATVYVETVPVPDMRISANVNRICAGGSLSITASGAQSYSWYPPASLSATNGFSAVATPSGNTNYTIIGSNSTGGVVCWQLASYSVMVVPNASAQVCPNTTICEGDRVMLKASGGDTFRWTSGKANGGMGGEGVVVSPTVSTIYTVDVSYGGYCGSSSTVQVFVHPKPLAYAGRDTTFNMDDVMSLRASGNGTLTWLSGEGIYCATCATTQIMPTTNNCYVVEFMNDFGCKAQDDVCIKLTGNYSIYIPNTFTPNNDGLNDVFYIYGTGITELKLDIYDRWGQHLFSSGSLTNGWDGTYKATDCEQGTYIYNISYRGFDGKTNFKTGQVNIAR